MIKIEITYKLSEETKAMIKCKSKSLLDENTEVVSSAESESSVYTDVRESHASGDTEQPQALVEGALEKITNTERAKCHRSDDLCFCNASCDKVKCTFYH